ncbi:MAG: DUF1003 domain-containing protein, partial [Acidobacteriales bacterium]|nr:DUF1003 domain-containing protein [Terriglobales bacterium]
GHQHQTHRAHHRPRSVNELTRQNVETVLRLEEATKAKRTRAEKAADTITRLCGSMTFVWIHVVWYGVWIIANVALPEHRRFDPFPFSFLTLVVSLEAIFLATFILISQNRQTALADRRAQLDLQVDLLSEQENTKMLELLHKIGSHLGIKLDNDPETQALEEATQPKKLLQQIDQTLAKEEKH